MHVRCTNEIKYESGTRYGEEVPDCNSDAMNAVTIPLLTNRFVLEKQNKKPPYSICTCKFFVG